jgi:hypothetical protein
MATNTWYARFPNWDGTVANLGKVQINDTYYFSKAFRGMNGFGLQTPTNSGANAGSFSIGTSTNDTVTVGGRVTVGNNLTLALGTNGDNSILYTRPSLTLRQNGGTGRFTITNDYYGSFSAGNILTESSITIRSNDVYQFRSARSSGWIASNYAQAIGLNLINNTLGTTRTKIFATKEGTNLVAAESHEDGGMLLYGQLRFDGGYTLPDTDGTAGAVLTTDGAGTASWVGGADPGLAFKTTASGTSFGYLNGQTIGQTLYRPAVPLVARSINTTLSVEGNTSVSFKPENTQVRIDLQMYVRCASGETISMALSNSSGAFSDVGTTETIVYTNGSGGSHDLTSNIQVSFLVTGLTAGTAYTWYPAIKSSSTGSAYLVGVTSPGITMEARHVAT